MKSFLKKITQSGVDPALTYHQNSRIILLNYMCFIGILVSFIFLIINLAKNNNPIFLVNNLVGQTIFFATIFLNRKKHYAIAVWFCCISFLLFINFIAVVNGPQSGAVYINLVVCISSLLFFERKSDIVILSLLSFIAFFTCHFIYRYHPIAIENKNIQVYFYVYSSALFLACYVIVRRYKREIMNYTSEILNQKNELHLKNQEISDSLFYARNIQRSILKFDPSIEKAFADSFLLFKPKDVVSGDFFWIHEEDEKIIGCVADCTGHGVPGALMSMIGITLLRESVIEKKMFDPSSILERIRNGIIQILKQTEEPSGSKDGMDISLCVYDKTSKILNYSGANNDCYVIRGSEIIELKAAKLPIGIYPGEEQSFHSITMQLEKNDSIFMFTDGFADQFGGPAGKKFKKKNLLSMILKNSSLPLKQQKKLLEEEFHRWKEQFEQTDDITIFGVRV